MYSENFHQRRPLAQASTTPLATTNANWFSYSLREASVYIYKEKVK